MILKGAPYKTAVEAAQAAIDQAKDDLDHNVFRHLVYGGPGNPEHGLAMDQLRALSIDVEAVAWCEICGYVDMYADVYNTVTKYQRIPGSPHPHNFKGQTVRMLREEETFAFQLLQGIFKVIGGW